MAATQTPFETGSQRPSSSACNRCAAVATLSTGVAQHSSCPPAHHHTPHDRSRGCVPQHTVLLGLGTAHVAACQRDQHKTHRRRGSAVTATTLPCASHTPPLASTPYCTVLSAPHSPSSHHIMTWDAWHSGAGTQGTRGPDIHTRPNITQRHDTL